VGAIVLSVELAMREAGELDETSTFSTPFLCQILTVPKGDEGHKNYFIMSENVYWILFDYDGKTHSIPNLSTTI
jgi:hypothetical protein